MSVLDAVIERDADRTNGILSPEARLSMLALLVVLVLAAPLLNAVAPFLINVLTRIFVFALLVLSLDFVFGYCGLPSFGHAAMFGAGGYTVAFILMDYSPNVLLNLAAAVVVGFVIAAAMGWLSVRTYGLYFAFLTLAFSQMLYVIAFQDIPADLLGVSSVTNGDNGLVGLPLFELPMVDLFDPLAYYYFALLFLVLSTVAIVRLANSPFGTVMRGIHENEDRMIALGYDVQRYKVLAFAISGGFAGLAGAIFAPYQSLVHPQNLHWLLSGNLIIWSLVGGLGTLWGPMVAAAAITYIEHAISGVQGWLIAIGVIYIVVILFARNGIAGVFGRLLAGLRRAREDGAGAAIDHWLEPLRRR